MGDVVFLLGDRQAKTLFEEQYFQIVRINCSIWIKKLLSIQPTQGNTSGKP